MMKVGRTFDYRCNGVIDIIQYILTNFSSKLYLHFLFYRVYFSSLLSNLITLEINNTTEVDWDQGRIQKHCVGRGGLTFFLSRVVGFTHCLWL